jgi:hypothetical protein
MKHFKLMKGVLACLLSLALVLSCFTTVGIKAAEGDSAAAATVTAPSPVDATYNPKTDTLTTTGKVIYVLKAESGNNIKAGAKCYEVSATATDNTLTAIGAKAPNKDVYLYVCDKQFETAGTGIKANVVIKAQAAKKIVGNIDFTQADDPESVNVLSIKATDKAGKEIEGAQLIWSEDGTAWKEASEFTGEYLAKKLEAGASIQVKMLGDEKTRTSKAIKVKIPKLGKQPKVKADVKKDTYSIKNGMDFALFTKSGEKYEKVAGTTWKTILPVLKTAKTATVDDSIVDTNSYKPLDKKDKAAPEALTDGKVSYTKVKIKALGYDKLASIFGSAMQEGTKYYLGVRTSATAKKPASDISYFEFSLKAEAPIVYTESKVKDQYLVASGKEFAKKGFVIGTVANYAATEGYDDSFKFSTTAGSGADTATAAYEYAVVKLADITPSGSGEVAIDWSTVSWKKLDPAKTKISAKLKGKYNTIKGSTTSKVSVNLAAWTYTASGSGAATSYEATEEIPEGVTTALLVRRAGVKNDSLLASNYQILYVVKNGSNYEIYSTKSVGEEAAPYTVNFYKWTGSKSGETTTYDWVKDDSLTITGWGGGKAATTEYVSFPEASNADFFELTTSGSGYAISSGSGAKLAAETSNDHKGKYAVSVGAGSGAVTLNVAIREYANIKVVAAASGEGTTDTKEIGAVKAGKISSTSGDKLVDGTSVTAYVGTATEIPVLAYTVPTGYVSSGSGSVTGATLGENTVTVTVDSTDEVTVTVKYPVQKIKVTYNLNTPSGFDLDPSGAAIAAVEVGSNGKIAKAADVSAIKATKTDENGTTTNVIKGWSKSETGDTDIETTEVFTANTTIYAIWGTEASS